MTYVLYGLNGYIKMAKYNIYAGINGGFGGAQYKGTSEYKSDDEAEQEAYELAVEDYESYAGFHGILSWNDIAKQNELDPCEDSDEIDELYQQEIDDWIEYYAVLTEEDDLDPEDIEEL